MRIQKWEVGPVKLVNGWDAVIHHFCEKRKQYLGWVRDGQGGCFAREWNDLGWYSNGIGQGDSMNLAPLPKKKVQLHRWANVYKDGSMFSYPTKKEADDSAQHGRFACIEIDREVEEGEGL